MAGGAVMDEVLAGAFLAGYLHEAGPTAELDVQLLVHAMEMACFAWWAWEVIETPIFVEGEINLQRLELLRSDAFRGKLVRSLERLIRQQMQSSSMVKS